MNRIRPSRMAQRLVLVAAAALARFTPTTVVREDGTALLDSDAIRATMDMTLRGRKVYPRGRKVYPRAMKQSQRAYRKKLKRQRANNTRLSKQAKRARA